MLSEPIGREEAEETLNVKRVLRAADTGKTFCRSSIDIPMRRYQGKNVIVIPYCGLIGPCRIFNFQFFMSTKERDMLGEKDEFYIFIYVLETGNNVFYPFPLRDMRCEKEKEKTVVKQYHINTVIIQNFLYTCTRL